MARPSSMTRLVVCSLAPTISGTRAGVGAAMVLTHQFALGVGQVGDLAGGAEHKQAGRRRRRAGVG